MSEVIPDAVRIYLRQQAEMGMPDIILDNPACFISKRRRTSDPVKPDFKPAPTHKPASSPVARKKFSTEGNFTHTGDSLYHEKRNLLVTLYTSTLNCTNCPLGASRKKYVFGSGNAGAKLMIIGEAPGEEEDLQGVPFVGPAGKLLTKMLTDINIDRKNDAFLTNVLKCRPPGNRTPIHAECLACSQILHRQIEIIAPRIILLLGRVAANTLLLGGNEEPLAKLRGNKLDYNGIQCVVTYHPSAILHNQQYREPAEQDFRLLQEIMKNI
jgi:DNA polymerase